MYVVFFDLDGVLIDSRPAIASCLRATLAGFGLARPDDAELDAVIGPPLGDGFARLLARRGASLSLVPACVDAFRASYGEVAVAGTALQAGIAEVLPRLRARAVLSIATSKPQHLADPIVEALGIRNWFEAVVGPSHDHDGESKSGTLERAIAATEAGLGTTVATAWKAFVGDRKHDIVAAREHAVYAIGATWGYGSEDELRRAGAQAIVYRPLDLLGLLP